MRPKHVSQQNRIQASMDWGEARTLDVQTSCPLRNFRVKMKNVIEYFSLV